MNSPAYDIAQKIAAEGLATFGGSTAWVVGVNTMLDNPDEFLAVTDVGGVPGDTISDVEFDSLWSVQIKARAATRDAAVNKLDAITAAMNLLKNYSVVDGAVTINYIVQYRATLPGFLAHDERKRPIYVMTWSGMREWS